jgi:hypothetical protein
MSPARAARGRAKHSGTAANREVAKERAAKKACVTGDVKTGIELLGDLYVDTDDATYIFNQGRCYQQNRRLEEAIDRFREYLRKVPNASVEQKSAAEAHIAECEALHARRSFGPPPPAPQAALPMPGTIQQPVLTSAPEPRTPVPSPMAIVPAGSSAPRSDGGGLRIAGILTTAVGLSAVGTGVLLNIKERSLTNEINSKFSRSKESSRASYETWGYVSYSVGAAAIIGGATLYYLGWRAGKVRLSALPTLMPNGTTIVLNGSF